MSSTPASSELQDTTLGGWPEGFTAEDAQALRRTVNHLRAAAALRDTEALRPYYHPDVRWMNAFGSRLCGRDAVVEYLHLLWETPQFQARGRAHDEGMDFWCLSRDIVVVHTYHEIEGQRTLDGQELARRTHSEKILVRGSAGWIVRSELFADERDQRQRLLAKTRAEGDPIRTLAPEEAASLG